jgi:hypothetical protein
MKIDPSYDRIQDWLKVLMEKRAREKERKKNLDEFGRLLFTLFCILVLLISVRLGLDICLRIDGNCEDNTQHLLFKPQENIK